VSSTAQDLIPEPSKNIQVIERTSKHYKAQKLYSLALFVVGLIITGKGTSSGAIGTTTLGGVCIAVSIVWGIAVSISSWWHHG
jgi:drug/metabolite transporter superfamily protein YnfA